MDLAYLFNTGENYEAYRFLGSHAEVWDGRRGWVFRVWAPRARRVSVVGSFNDWDKERQPMLRLGDTGIWETFVEGLQAWSRYKYCILGADGNEVFKADPFAVHQECRPGTSSILYEEPPFPWTDEAFLQQQTPAWDPRPLNIYEVHLASWRRYPDGNVYNYREIAQQLASYCKEMGYTAIELLPITEYPLDDSWGYQVSGYFAPTSRYGTPDDFKDFVNTLHEAGLRVFLDWVPAHFPKDAFGLYRFDGSPCYEYADSRLGEQISWGTMVFDFSRSEVRSFLMSSAHYWVREYHVDGLRIDAVSSMLYLDYGRTDFVRNIHGGNDNLEAIDFLQKLNSSLLREFPNLYIMAEESTAFPYITRPVSEGGLGFTHKWCMGWMHDCLDYFSQDYYARKYHHNKMTFSMTYVFSEHHLLPLSHDEVVHGKRSLIGRMPGDIWRQCASLRCLFAWQIGHPGGKLNFMGNEFGQFIEWRFAEELQWFMLEHPHHRQLQEYSKALNHLYLEHDELWRLDQSWEGFQWTQVDDRENSVFVFARKNGKKFLLFLLNMTPAVHHAYRFKVPAYGRYRVLINSDDPCWGGSSYLSENEVGREYLTVPASAEAATQEANQRFAALCKKAEDLQKDRARFEDMRQDLLAAYREFLPGSGDDDPHFRGLVVETAEVPPLPDKINEAELTMDLPPLAAVIMEYLA